MRPLLGGLRYCADMHFSLTHLLLLPSHMDSQPSPEDYHLLDEETIVFIRFYLVWCEKCFVVIKEKGVHIQQLVYVKLCTLTPVSDLVECRKE